MDNISGLLLDDDLDDIVDASDTGSYAKCVEETPPGSSNGGSNNGNTNVLIFVLLRHNDVRQT